jgi:hypothetical protein
MGNLFLEGYDNENYTRLVILPVADRCLPCMFAQVKSKEQAVEIPFDFYRNEIILSVNVNGKGPFNMMLDTGTDPSAVDLSTARNIGLKLQPLGKPATGGGTDVNLTYYTRLPLVEVGGLTVKNLETH